ncbi:hypothetical protein AB9K34_07530 [Sedimentitalea sp. XS_ASV28]|uniref:hypothetical protein n=1 Tax=Sedimentitalea sp. XS_ASV28 TaxID=3241296 RepID=UPI00351295FC
MTDRETLPGETAKGAGPFITLRTYRHHGAGVRWRARQHRKGLSRHPDQTDVPVWQRAAYNWWTGLCFSVGSLLFMLGALLSVLPYSLAPVQIARMFFLGSIPFTIAGFLQNFQAANATEFSKDAPGPPRRVHLLGWRPHDPGWLSTITQFAGTIAFNFNTFDAINPVDGWYLQDLTIWLPGMIGSVLFLLSGYLAFVETGHAYWSWRPRDLDWQIVFINLLGCIFFMVAGLLAYIPKGPEPGWVADLANIHLFFGALCFLTGALLMMRESRQVETLGSNA